MNEKKRDGQVRLTDTVGLRDRQNRSVKGRIAGRKRDEKMPTNGHTGTRVASQTHTEREGGTETERGG